MKRGFCLLFVIVILSLGESKIFCMTPHQLAQPYSVAVVGTGYVGLITGSCLADLGNHVVCYDINEAKIDLLKNGTIPIYETGLQEVVERNTKAGRLAFTTNPHEALSGASIIFIAVDTPMGAQGDADLRAVKAVIETISDYLDSYKIICMKSTVPVGTCNWVISEFEKKGINKDRFDVVSNPEFLREGSAVYDFMNPDRIVIGANGTAAAALVGQLYAPLVALGVPIVSTSLVSSETIKYASNAFLASKLSFINEIANFCEKTGAIVSDVAYGMGLDKRIGAAFLKPGPGFGGSCFPKDCHALLRAGQKNGIHLHMIETALAVNDAQKKICVQRLDELLHNEWEGKTIAVLGLAFKANTDDIRYSPAITALQMLEEKNIRIQAYDPAAAENMKKMFPSVYYAASAYDALTGADAVLVMTEWDEFKTLDWQAIYDAMRNHIIVDMRNIVDAATVKALDFVCYSLGRKE